MILAGTQLVAGAADLAPAAARASAPRGAGCCARLRGVTAGRRWSALR